ncbi:hypothetical protein NJLHNGOC_14550 [Novacetimonas cocois]|uniref:Uncharacterized protein n=1 Tax=Novacetimonas cocois TaxID=1747507 RepID=A0A365YQF4_9PROT|nr:hypothetical protein NJLHNGOC_14550 [Novacetimonas cocois]
MIFRFPDVAGTLRTCGPADLRTCVLMACALWKTPADMLLTSCQEYRALFVIRGGRCPEDVHPKGNGGKIEQFV